MLFNVKVHSENTKISTNKDFEWRWEAALVEIQILFDVWKEGSYKVPALCWMEWCSGWPLLSWKLLIDIMIYDFGYVIGMVLKCEEVFSWVMTIYQNLKLYISPYCISSSLGKKIKLKNFIYSETDDCVLADCFNQLEILLHLSLPNLFPKGYLAQNSVLLQSWEKLDWAKCDHLLIYIYMSVCACVCMCV